MSKVDKRFTILFSDEELMLLKANANLRGMSVGELVRVSVQNEITQKSVADKLRALHKIYNLGKQSSIL
ncbi:MAG: CopG family transcriptional regulator [Leptospiraceae bacterium]|nr:CopG family transcriptional regulator [Leptospiraceae bacterium]